MFTGEIFNNCQVVTEGDTTNPWSAKATFTSCVFYDCNSEDKGGAIYANSGIRISVDQCEFVKCQAQNMAGAMYVCSNDQWLGSWDQKESLPSISVTKTCFSDCLVVNDPEKYTGEQEGIGFALYTKAVQVMMTDFAAVDCARDQAKNAAVFFGWINELETKNGNLSIAKFSPSNLGAFSVCYVGRKSDDLGRWLSVKHTNHYVQGFTCQYVYHAMLQDGICNHELTQIDVIDTAFSGQYCAIFYAQGGNVDDWRRSKLKLNKCQVINVKDSNLGTFCKFDLGNDDIEKTECKCNIAEWSDITQTTDYSPYVDPIVVECDYQPPTTDTESVPYTDEGLESDTDWQSSLESKDDQKDPEDQNDKDGSPLSTGAIVGIVLAILILIAIIIVILFLLRRRRLSSSGSENSDKEHEMDETETSATTNTTVQAMQ